LAVDIDPGKLEGLPGRTISGNVESYDVLEEAGVEHARLLVSALQIEDVNRVVVFRARAAGVPVSVHAFDQEVVDELEEIGADHLIHSKHAGTRRLAQLFQRGGVLGA
jgi:Trk K+ transport system NAD-binding subunit